MTDDEAYAFYSDPENLRPVGPGRRRQTQTMTDHVPVRFSAEMLAEMKRMAEQDSRTLSGWVRYCVQREIVRLREPVQALTPDLNVIRRAAAERNDTPENRNLFDLMAATWIEELCDEVARLRAVQSNLGGGAPGS